MEDGVPVYFAKMLPNNPQVELPAVAPGSVVINAK